MGPVEPYDRLGEEMSERRMVIFEFGFQVASVCNRMRDVVSIWSRGGKNGEMFGGASGRKGRCG